jgi:hypothetical protein
MLVGNDSVEACKLSAQPFLPLLPPGLLVTPYFITPPMPFYSPRFSCFPATSSRAPPRRSSRHLPSAKADAATSHPGGYTNITRQALRHKFWALGGATVPSKMSPSTHYSTCNTRIQFLFIHNSRARNKQYHCVTLLYPPGACSV